jgi:hypothetical protein
MAISKETAKMFSEYSSEKELRWSMGKAKLVLTEQIGEAIHELHQPRHCAPLDLEELDYGVSLSPASIAGSLEAHATEIRVRLEIFLEAALALQLATAEAMADLDQIDEVHEIEEVSLPRSATHLVV